jgi:TPR repeat protein
MKKLSLFLLLLALAAGCAALNPDTSRQIMQEAQRQGQAAYEQGNYSEAFRLLHPAAEAGNPNAQYLIAIMYDFGRGREINHEEANVWYLKAAEQEQDDAQFNLAISYQRGEGIEADDDQAVYWLSRAAANGDADALQVLTDYASDEDNPAAQYALAKIYRDGVTLHNNRTLYPSERDNKAIAPNAKLYQKWLQEAAANGSPEATKELGPQR